MGLMVERITAAPLREGWVPGRRGAYDLIAAWYVLGAIVEIVTDRDLSSYLQENVFRPLGMEDTFARMNDVVYRKMRPRIGAIHVIEPTRVQSFVPVEGDSSYLQCNPGTSICGPTRDLGRFYAGLLRMIGADKADSILRTPTVEAAIATHRAGMKDETLKGQHDFGLGFETGLSRRIERASPRAFGLTGLEGAVEGFADPEAEIAIAASFNAVSVNRRRKWGTVVAAVYEDLRAGA